MKTIFVMLRCKPGTTYKVADALWNREFLSELHSISGDWDLLMKAYVPEGDDIGVYVNDKIADIDNIERTHTLICFKTF